MTISKRQFDLLNVMNIPLWVSTQSNKASVEKEVDVVEESKIAGTQHSIDHSIELIDPLLANNHLFSNILLTLGLSTAEISIEANSVNLGLINWQFSSTNTISFENNLLTTPTIEQLEKSPALKRQLWQLLIESELVCR